METVAPATVQTHHPHNQAGGANTVPLVIITLLFFMWGLLTSLNDVLMGRIEENYRLPMLPAKKETKAKLEKIAAEVGLLKAVAV